MSITMKSYIQDKGRKLLQKDIAALETRIVNGMTDESVDIRDVEGSRLGVAFGTAGGATEDQQETMNVVLRLATFAGCDAPPESSPISASAWKLLCVLKHAMGATQPPKLQALAKRAATKIVAKNLASSFVSEHGGFSNFATDAVVGNLFPTVKVDKAAGELAYIHQSLLDLAALAGLSLE